MNAPVLTLVRAGAEASMLEEFRALAEATAPDGAPRYKERPVLEDLARFLTRGGGGPNRDAAFYELCHLVGAVDAAGNGRDRRNAFFMGPEAASPARFRARLDAALAKGGWRRAGFARTDDGIIVSYPEGPFTIRFGRMPFVAALYEFLAGMEGFGFYPILQEILDDMTLGAHAVKTVQAASNRIASHFRQYRRRHLAQTQQEGKFDVILAFLLERSPHGRLRIDDAGVFDFWAERSTAGDFRAYRTVFDAFANFLRACDEASRAEAITAAASIGTDRENGEIEPDDSHGAAETCDGWTSPFALLDEEPAAQIKFFKKEGERKPLEVLMHYGPTAVRLPLAFLRLESFSPVQSAITTDLQIGRGRDLIESRASCCDAAAYPGIVSGFAQSLENVRRLQKAAFYALHKTLHGNCEDAGNVAALRPTTTGALFDQALDESVYDSAAVETLVTESAKIFRGVARKGFDEAGLADVARIEGFRVGAVALIRMAAQIEGYLAAAGRISQAERDLDGWFDADRRAFRERFSILYGVSP